MVKTILDTNIIISYLISKNNSEVENIIRAAKEKRIQLFCSIEIWNELLEALKYPKIARLLPNNNGTFITKYKFLCEFIEPKSSVELCRDPRDNKFLELAIEIGADYLITGDKDLLEIISYETTMILQLNDFFEILTQQKRD